MGSAHSCCTNSGKSTADTVNLENNCEHVTADEYIDPSLGMFSDIDINSDRKPFKVTLMRDGPHWNNIGVVLSPDDSPDYLTIDDVNYPSLLGFWNERCHKHQKVKAGDMIRAVNEMSSTGEQMLLMIQTIGKGEEIRFLIEAGPENFGDRTSFACPERISVFEVPLQTRANGLYLKQPFRASDRPVYRHENGVYLYYWQDDRNWKIGDHYNSPVAIVMSKPYEEASCPTLASVWLEAVGSASHASKRCDPLSNPPEAVGEEMFHERFAITVMAASVPEPQKADSPQRSRGKPKKPSAARKYPELRPHFEALDISQDSSNNDIRRHYRRLARIWHPDKNPDNYLEATRRFQAINTAYLAIKAKLNL